MRQIHRLELLGDRVGNGAFGSVFKVLDTRSNTVKALKVYSQCLDEKLDEIRNEYNMLRTL